MHVRTEAEHAAYKRAVALLNEARRSCGLGPCRLPDLRKWTHYGEDEPPAPKPENQNRAITTNGRKRRHLIGGLSDGRT